MSQFILWIWSVFAATSSATPTEGVIQAGNTVVVVDGSVVPASGAHHRPRVASLCPPTTPAYPDCPPLTPGTPGMPPDPTMPPVVPPPDLSGLTTPFATQTGAGGLQGRAFNEAFDGDFGGTYYRKNIVPGSRTVTQQVGTTTRTIVIRPPNGGPPITQVITVPVFGNVTVPVTQALL